MQHALQPAEPVSRLPLALSVLPSNMPAELLMTYQGEVRRRDTCTGGLKLVRWIVQPAEHHMPL